MPQHTYVDQQASYGYDPLAHAGYGAIDDYAPYPHLAATHSQHGGDDYQTMRNSQNPSRQEVYCSDPYAAVHKPKKRLDHLGKIHSLLNLFLVLFFFFGFKRSLLHFTFFYFIIFSDFIYFLLTWTKYKFSFIWITSSISNPKIFSISENRFRFANVCTKTNRFAISWCKRSSWIVHGTSECRRPKCSTATASITQLWWWATGKWLFDAKFKKSTCHTGNHCLRNASGTFCELNVPMNTKTHPISNWPVPTDNSNANTFLHSIIRASPPLSWLSSKKHNSDRK